MDRLPPHARALLERARDAHDPTSSQRASADAAARTELARCGIHDLPQLSAAGRAGAEQAAQRVLSGTSRSITPIRLGLMTIAAAASLGALVLFAPWRERETGEAASAPAALQASGRAPQDRSPAPSVTPPQPAELERPVAQARQPSPEPARARRLRERIDSRARASAEPDALAAELRFIATVDAHVRDHDFDAALRLLESKTGAAPHAKLREERRALRVLALCGSGPSAHALREREQFLRAAPKSLLAARVRAACAGKPR